MIGIVIGYLLVAVDASITGSVILTVKIDFSQLLISWLQFVNEVLMCIF